MVIDAIERSAVCRMFVPIGWSVRDTDQTILEVKAHNKVHADTCGKPNK